MFRTSQKYSFRPLTTTNSTAPPSPDFEYVAITARDQVKPGHIYEEEFVAVQALEETLFPNDAESLNHYKKMLSFNNSPRIQEQWNKAQYVIIFARHVPSRKIAGAIIYQTLLTPEKMLDELGVGATCANQFTFSDSRWRAHGIGNTLLVERGKQIDAFLAEQGRKDALCSIGHEILDPMFLSAGEHLRIRTAGEYCPFERIHFWGKRGQRSFSINYVIPRTAEGIPARRQYRLHMNSDDGAPSTLVDYHVTTSIALCYLDGAHPRDNHDYQKMQAEIHSSDFHPTSDRRQFFVKIKEVVDELLGGQLSKAELRQPLGFLLNARYPGLIS